MEDVRMLVQEEGRAARNLIAFHVDLAAPATGKTVNRKPPSSPRLLNDTRMTKRSSLVAKTGSRIRSASTGRDKKSELQARYWAFLFGNLQRAVDEIYQTCETDESVSECKEVILVLENFTRDFHNLIEWFKLKWEYENTPPPQRPTSLAWEVRKSSPGKVMAPSRFDKISRSEKQSPVKKQLNFFSDVKLSSAEESPSKAFTLENELSNQYGLSFGDVNLKEHFKPVDPVIEVPNTVNLPETKINTKDGESNKENCPNITKNTADGDCKPAGDIISNNQSSQTDEKSLQSPKALLKPSTTSTGLATKKSLSSVKTATVMSAKVSTLSPLAVNKTVPGSSTRKTVPVSPTNTVPPRAVPGKNVAAAAFIPGKKVAPTSQAKINTNLNKSSSNLTKLQNVPQQSSEKSILNEEIRDSNVLNTHKLAEQKKVDLGNDAIDNRLTDIKESSVKKNDSVAKQTVIENNQNEDNNTIKTDHQATEKIISDPEKPVINGECFTENTPVGEENIDKLTVANHKINNVVNNKQKKEEEKNVVSNEASNLLSIQKNTQSINEGKSINSNNENNHAQDNAMGVNLNNKTTNSEKSNTKNVSDGNCTEKQNNVNSEKLVKPHKIDKGIMTDISHLSLVAAAKQTAAKVTTLVRNKTVPNFTRKSNELLALSETSTETPKPLKSNAINSPKTVASALKKPSSIPELMHEKLLKEKPSNEKQPSNEKPSSEKQASVRPANEKPAYSTISKVYRSNTAIELRPSRVAFDRNVSSATVKSVNNEKQMSSGKGTSPNIRNPTLMKKSNTLFKSEQNLRKKNSVDEDGWETVKGRSRWKLSESSSNIKIRKMTASSRFYLPSPATSLPALALASEDSEIDPKPAKLHKDRQNQEIAKANKVALRNKLQSATPKQSVKPQSEKLISSLKKGRKEDLVERKNGLNERKKIPNARIKSVDIKKTVNGVNSGSNDNKIEKLIDILTSEEERLNEEEIRKSMELYEKEKILTKEIQDLEKVEIEVDTETDDAETDGEATTGTEDDDTDCRINALKASYEDVCNQLSWADQMDTLEKLEQLMAMDTSTKGIPWAERLTTLEQLEELVARHPGRALELHQKLSSPSRRRPLPDTIQRHRARQASAQIKRQRLLQDKTNKMRELLNKVEEVKMAQAQLVEERKKRLADKLKRAEENRASHLRSIQRKAHDEEEKLREIAFINELEAQNKRHDFMALCQEQQERLQGILDERQRRQEEKAAKEAAVEERRRILEAERQEKLEKMQERRRKREERIGREQQEKEKERLELAREKARDREERLQALQAAQLATVEELQKKIQQKQFDSARRHEENIEHIRQRALESGALRGSGDDEAPRLTPYETHKLCRVCNVLMESEVYLLSHLRGKAHQEAVKDLKDDSEPVIIDAPPDKMDAKLAQDRERQKALRKRCKKIRSRMALRGTEYLAKLSSEATKKLESPNKTRLLKCIRNVDKLHSSQGVGQWPNNAITLLERNLAEINRILDKQNVPDQKVFQDLNGFTTLSNILNLALDIPKNMSPYLPPKCFLTTCMVYSLACDNNPDNSRYVFFSNKIALVLDLLLNRLNALITDDYKTSNKSSTNLPVDPVAGALMKLFALILSYSQENVPADLPDMAPRLQDIISYTVSVGVVDKLALYCSSVRDPIDNNPQAAQFLLSAIQLLTTLAQTKCSLVKGDPTQLVATLRVTELVGGVSMLYGMLLHQGAPPSSPSSPPPSLPPHTVHVTKATLQLLRAVAQLDLAMFQNVLGAEGISLQLRHIASYLLWYCSHTGGSGGVDDWLVDKRDLLHQVIEVVGYFAVMHYDNQMMLQSGHMPTVLQQLCNLPFEYFSDPSLSCHLFPTLLACCHGNQENRAILEQELSYQLLEDFRKSEAARTNPLVQLIK